MDKKYVIDIREKYVEKIEKGLSLEAGDLTQVSDFLRGCRKVKAFFENKEGYAENLCSYALSITDLLFL